jgi:hypothetical protein
LSQAQAVRFDVPAPGHIPAPESQADTEKKVAPPRGTPEYQQYMSEIYDRNRGAVKADPKPEPEKPVAAAPVAAPEIPKMPDGGFDKFYDKKTGGYNWQAHAREVEFKLNQKAKPEAPKPEVKPEAPAAGAEGTPEAPKEGEAPTEEKKDDPAKEVAEKAGLNWDDLRSKFEKNQAIEESDYEALTKVGIPRDVIDSHIEALKIAREANARTTYDYAGGQDRMNAALQWAATNLPENEKTAINKTLASADWRVGVDALLARFDKSKPGAGEPNLVSAGGEPAATVEGFKSQSEMLAAMSKRAPNGMRMYDVDVAYRADVRKRIALMK